MAEYILDTTDGIFNARMTGEIVRCRNCAKGSQRSDGLFRCSFWTALCGDGEIARDGDEYCSEGEEL